LTEESSPLVYFNGHSDHQNVGSLLAQNLNLMPLLLVKDEKGEKLRLQKMKRRKSYSYF
jgi:hypothetical protein